jgi:hypothetical protein
MPAVFPQQAPSYQQPPPFFAPAAFNPNGQFQQTSMYPYFQQMGSPVPNAATTKNKWKKKNGAPATVPPQQIPFVQPQMPFLLGTVPPSWGGVVHAGPSAVVQQAAAVQVVVESDVVALKPSKCWKYSVDTHATKDCKVLHYYLVCDNVAHPTLRCPTLKLPKSQAFVAGPSCEESLCLRLPGSVYKAHLAPKGLPTALIKITGGTAFAEAIQSVVARICPLSSKWKWEAITHGDDAFLVSFPTAEDLWRIDGFQWGVPNSSVQMTFWQVQDVPHSFELQQVWVHVKGV